ncbi:hypothetical protein RSAG8_05574, partial [Rhizoctonia solani AG-8 WAC10335]
MDTISFVGVPPSQLPQPTRPPVLIVLFTLLLLYRWRGPGGTLGRRPAFPASPAYSSSGTDHTLYPPTTVLPTGPGIRLSPFWES